MHLLSLPLVLFLLTVATRIPFTSRYFYHMDSIDFSLALDKFDVALHQPHPPGFFLYVMLGRLVRLFIDDANKLFTGVSILFSGLTVVVIYYLAREFHDRKIALLAAALAVVSPSFWFYGEVALTYVPEAFFSALMALCCWKISTGKRSYIWLSAIILGIAGGMRQNTAVFLLPLWLYSMRFVKIRDIFMAIAVFVVVCLTWFVPMVWMTGGLRTYLDAFREIYLYSMADKSIFAGNWIVLLRSASSIGTFVIYGLGISLVPLIFAGYLLLRSRQRPLPAISKMVFFVVWIFPPLSFHLLFGIHPETPGYTLIFLPALLIAAASATDLMCREVARPLNNVVWNYCASVLVIINAAIFVLSPYRVSYRNIQTHDQLVSRVIEGFSTFDPCDTALFVPPFIYYGSRHVMYYLPEFRVYSVDGAKTQSGEVRRIFWGLQRKTSVADVILMPHQVTQFAAFVINDGHRSFQGKENLRIHHIGPNAQIVSGPIEMVGEVCPELKGRVRSAILVGSSGVTGK